LIELWDILDENGNATGRFHERGKPMCKGEYHLTVNVWIENDNGEYLISQRSPNKPMHQNLWECTGGNAVTGDDSLTTALKEVKEEFGLYCQGLFFRQENRCRFSSNFPLSEVKYWR